MIQMMLYMTNVTAAGLHVYKKYVKGLSISLCDDTIGIMMSYLVQVCDGGMKYDGWWEGYYIERYPNGHIKVRGNMHNGISEGEYKEYSLDGELFLECSFTHGLLNGKYMYISADGMRITTTYSHGVLHGKYTKQWQHNPTPLLECNYSNGKLHGVLKELNPNGFVHTKIYRNGGLVDSSVNADKE